MSVPSDLVEIDVEAGSFFWQTTMLGVRFGDSDLESYSFTNLVGYTAVFDTGSALVYVPTTSFEGFMDKLLKNAPNAYVEEYIGIYYTYCDASLWP